MPLPEETYDLSLLEASRQKWTASAGLRLVYGDIFEEMGRLAIPGDSLEVGSGIGAMKETLREIVTSDLERTHYVDEKVSCYEIGEGNRRWANILAVDVLHHLRFPLRFFESAAEALVPGGRIILSEPAATGGGCLFYGAFHHEPCRPAKLTPPFEFAPDNENGAFANMGMGMALFVEHRAWMEKALEELGLRLVHVRFRDLVAYPASGGYSKPTLLPPVVLKTFLQMEKRLPQWLLRKAALRMTVALERTT